MDSETVIYEVNISLPRITFEEQEGWLYEHFQGMLEQPGFLRANIFADRDAGEAEARMTIHYIVRNKEALEAYLGRPVTAMRAAATDRLGPDYRVHRRVLQSVNSLHAGSSA